MFEKMNGWFHPSGYGGKEMRFYQLLQFDPFILKQKMRQATPSEKYYYFMALMVRAILLVGFAMTFVCTISWVFGNENKSLAVVLFCMLLTFRVVDFGYKMSHSIISIGIILMIFGLLPLLEEQKFIVVKWLGNFLCLSTLFVLTGSNPSMGNSGLYGFSYLFLMGTAQHLTKEQFYVRTELLVVFFIVLSTIFFIKHKDKHINKTWKQEFLGDNLFSQRNLWLIYCAFGLSILLLMGDLFSFQRFMWIGFAFSSLISSYGTDIKKRIFDRLVGIIVGSILFGVISMFLLNSILGIVGGLALGFCSSYRTKTIFNCFGALSVANSLYPINVAINLRIIDNIIGLVFCVLYIVACKAVLNKVLIKRRFSN